MSDPPPSDTVGERVDNPTTQSFLESVDKAVCKSVEKAFAEGDKSAAVATVAVGVEKLLKNLGAMETLVKRETGSVIRAVEKVAADAAKKKNVSNNSRGMDMASSDLLDKFVQATSDHAKDLKNHSKEILRAALDNADRIERINREDRIESHRHTETLLLPLLPSLGPSQNGKRARPAGNNDSATQAKVHSAVRVWQFKSKKSKQTLTFDDAVATAKNELKTKLGNANDPQLLQSLIETSLLSEYNKDDSEKVDFLACADELESQIEVACADRSLIFCST